MKKNIIRFVFLSIVCLFMSSVASAQSWSDRVATVKRKRQQQNQQVTVGHPAYKMKQTISQVDFDQTPFKQTLQWWQQATGVSMLINWSLLENEGIDPSFPITLNLRNIPATVVLDLLLEMASQEAKLHHYETKWYVQILTRDQILKKTQVRMYDVRDLLFQPKLTSRPPKMGLSAALSRSGTVGGSSGSSSSDSVNLFGDSDNDSNDDKKRSTKKERAEELIDIIRQTIEPDIWVANGGLHSTVTYFKGMLIIKAPAFVHKQISSSANPLNEYERVNMGMTQSGFYKTGKTSIGTSATKAIGKSNISSVRSATEKQSVSGIASSTNKK